MARWAYRAAVRLAFEGGDDYENAITGLALAPFLTGDEPFAEELSAPGVSRAIDLVPLGSIARQVTEAYVELVLAGGVGWSILVQRYRNRQHGAAGGDGRRPKPPGGDSLAGGYGMASARSGNASAIRWPVARAGRGKLSLTMGSPVSPSSRS